MNIIKSHRALCLLHQDCTKTHRNLDTNCGEPSVTEGSSLFADTSYLDCYLKDLNAAVGVV